MHQFLSAGYIQTTPNCFIKALEFEQIHQRNAWNSFPLLGFGNSAYSFTGSIVRQNVRPAKLYNRLIEQGKSPEKLSQEFSNHASLFFASNNFT